MTFKELLKEKQITGYALSKNTGIPYTTINDLINGKTIIQNISLKHALLIADYLKVKIEDLAILDKDVLIDFLYFRNNTLHELKRKGYIEFIRSVVARKDIDYYYKNNGKKYAYYLLALIDYLSKINGAKVYQKRYNDYRKEKLEKPFFVGSDLITYKTVEEAEKDLGIKVIPEFKKFNIIEEDVFNVA